MRNLDAAAAARVRFRAESVAGASENHAAVFVVARDIHERVGQLLMGAGGPFHLGIVGMARHLEDAVAALHLDVFVLVAVVLEFDHRHRRCPSVSIRIRSASRNRCRECTKPRAETANRSTRGVCLGSLAVFAGSPQTRTASSGATISGGTILR